MKQYPSSTLGCGLALGALLLALPGCGGGDNGDPYQPPALSDGVIFTYPIDGQTDVPLGTRFYVTFSKDADANAVNQPCSVDAGGAVSGNLCLLGPGNSLVPLQATVHGPVVEFETDQLQAGTYYHLYVRNDVIGVTDTNLPASAPLLGFRTSQTHSISGAAPTVIAINGEDPQVYSGSAPSAARYPLMDFATMRVEFSEPLDEKTVVVGSSFELVAVDGATETPVAGALMVRRQHLSFDPDQDLTPGQTYRLKLGAGITDLNGENFSAASYELVPQDSNTCNCVINQQFNVTAGYGEAGFPTTSTLTGHTLNAIDLYSPLIGANAINLRDTTLQARLADPSHFGGLIPFVIRKGAALPITGLDLALGGKVPANLRTADIRASFISDVTGYMDRNPYRPYSTTPNDAKAPVFVYLIFDLALTATDAQGNAVLNQTIPHVQATGVARIHAGVLSIETVRTLELDLLGLARAPAHLVLGIQSDLQAVVPADMDAPTLTASYPVAGATDFPVRDAISLTFSEPLDSQGVAVNDQIILTDVGAGTQVPMQLEWDGSSLLLQPESPLQYGKQYQVQLSGLQDLAGNALSLSAVDPTGGSGSFSFKVENPAATAVAPMVSSVFPGNACALTAADADFAGRCVGGLSGDEKYLPASLPPQGRIEVQFTQPMDPASLTLGTSCNTGAVRVEQLDAVGNCVAVVAGTLLTDSRALRFTPAQPWQEGSAYRLTLASSQILGRNGKALNSDPLNGTEAADAGGANIVNPFSVLAAPDDIFLPLRLEPFTDSNGSGFVDGGESAQAANSTQVTVLSDLLGGIVTAASIKGDSHIYLSGALPVTVGQPEPLTLDGSPWGMTLTGSSQIPVQVHPGILYGTSITMASEVTVLGLLPIPVADVKTGTTILRLRQASAQPITGYIVSEEGQAQPQFVTRLDLYMDAPDMVIKVDIPLLGGLITVNHNLHSLPLSATVKGPISFLEDGRIRIEQANVSAINLQIDVSSIAGNGSIPLQLPAGSMHLTLIGNPLKGRK